MPVKTGAKGPLVWKRSLRKCIGGDHQVQIKLIKRGRASGVHQTKGNGPEGEEVFLAFLNTTGSHPPWKQKFDIYLRGSCCYSVASGGTFQAIQVISVGHLSSEEKEGKWDTVTHSHPHPSDSHSSRYFPKSSQFFYLS